MSPRATLNPPAATDVPEVRRRNSADSRARLLAAAGELFGQKGYEKTTVREVGQRANVDPAMIARYFGSKSALYLESLRPAGAAGRSEPFDVREPATIAGILSRVGPHGPTPTMYAAIRPHDDPELQSAAMDVLNRRLLAPTEAHARNQGLDQVQLRAEIITAALAGVMLSRTSQAFEALAQASPETVGALVAEMLGALLD